MFGNSVAGLIPKVALAVEHNFRAVFVIGVSPFADRDLFDAAGEHEIDRKFKIAIHESPKDAAIEGIQGLVHATCTLPSTGENSERAWSYLSSVLLKQWSLPPLGPKTLVIHLRGGDVYWGKRDLPNHGQPPLSFYMAVIESEAWDDVLVVHQGDVPHLASIVGFCSARGVSISKQAPESQRRHTDTPWSNHTCRWTWFLSSCDCWAFPKPGQGLLFRKRIWTRSA